MDITNRDRELLMSLKKYELLSTIMIETLIFKNIRKTTMLRRLRILEKEKLIKRTQNTTSQIHLWSITDQGAQAIGLEANKNSWNKNTLDHDLKLIDIRLRLEKCNLIQDWTTEQAIKSIIFKSNSIVEAKKKLIPDGVFITGKETQNKSVAVELELTLKDKKRIKEVVKNYLAKKDLNFVWYISNHKNILKNIFNEWKIMAKGSSGVRLIASLYDEVIANPLEAHIYTLEGVFKLKDFWRLTPAHTYAHTVSTQASSYPIQNHGVSANNYTTSKKGTAL